MPSRPVRTGAEDPRSGLPHLRLERRLLRTHRSLVAIDEVGRGALSGPVLCGAVLLRAGTGAFPAGLRDSKLLSPSARERLVPAVRSWVAASATGAASAAEIDALGIVAALRLAALRAVAQLGEAPDVVLLDGPHDWISLPPPRAEDGYAAITGHPGPPPVHTRVRGDRECASLAAASVLAKVARDEIMSVLARRHPEYDWAGNKGYASPTHVDALRRLGPCSEHRRSWSLPGVG